MKVFIVFAHPEIRSFNGSFMKATVEHLEKRGHEVRVSDLYRENFKAVVDSRDFLDMEESERLFVEKNSVRAKANGKLTDDVYQARENLDWADLVLFQFPFWWYNMPAIMRGWFERVYTFDYVFGKDIPRFGEGPMKGKKAMVVMTAGAYEKNFTPRSVDGPMDDLLWPITHNLLFGAGFDVIPSHITYKVDRATQEDFNHSLKVFLNTLDNIDAQKPIPFRNLYKGDYELPGMLLKDGTEKSGEKGFEIHAMN